MSSSPDSIVPIDADQTWKDLEGLCRNLPLVDNRRPEISGRGIVLGAVVDRFGQFLIHSRTAEFAYVVKGIVEALKKLNLWPDGFEFTSFQFLDNASVFRHHDTNDSLSLIFAFGDFSGGAFMTSEGEINIFRQPVLFTGSTEHWVEDHFGDRLSIAMYSHKRSDELSPSMLLTLLDCGFHGPHQSELPSEECPALKRDARQTSCTATVFEIGVNTSSVREFGSKISSHAVLHANEDCLHNITSTFPETYCFNLAAFDAHAFYEWTATVSGTKWLALLHLSGSEWDATFLYAFAELYGIADNKKNDFRAVIVQSSSDNTIAEQVSTLTSSLPFVISLEKACGITDVIWLWTIGDTGWPKGTREAKSKHKMGDVLMPAITMPAEFSRLCALEDCFIGGWHPKVQTFSLSDLVSEPMAVQQGSQSPQPRRLNSCEVERILGFRSDTTNKVKKEAGQELAAREQRRLNLLKTALPASVLKFAFAVMWPESKNDKPPSTHPIPPSCLEDSVRLRAHCGFINFVGLDPSDLGSSIGPHNSELYAGTSSMLVESIQARKAAGRHTHLSAVPAGLDPITHFNVGCSAVSPLDAEPEIAHDLEFCLQKLKELGSGIHEWRLNQLKLLSNFLEKHKGWGLDLGLSRSVSAARCSSHINIAANIVGAAIIGWPDDKLQELLVEGAKPMGPQPHFGIYRHRFTPQSIPLDSFLSFSNIMADLINNPPPPIRSKPTPFGLNP